MEELQPPRKVAYCFLLVQSFPKFLQECKFLYNTESCMDLSHTNITTPFIRKRVKNGIFYIYNFFILLDPPLNIRFSVKKNTIWSQNVTQINGQRSRVKGQTSKIKNYYFCEIFLFLCEKLFKNKF